MPNNSGNDRLTEKQKRFADEYITDLNATRAYMAVYLAVKKESVAAQAGSRLLKNVKVRAYIDARLQEISGAKVADAKEVMEYLSAVMRGDTTEEVVVVEGSGEGYSTARRIDKGIGARDRIKAAELIGKRYSLFTDRLQVEGATVVQIIDDITKEEKE